MVLALFWPAQAWFVRLQRLATAIYVLDAPAEAQFYTTKGLNPAWRIAVVEIGLGSNGRQAYERPSWTRPVTLQILAAPKKPPDSSELGWEQSIWTTRTSQ